MEEAEHLLKFGDEASGMKKLRKALGVPAIRSDPALLQRVLVGLGEMENHSAKLQQMLQHTSALVQYREASQVTEQQTV